MRYEWMCSRGETQIWKCHQNFILKKDMSRDHGYTRVHLLAEHLNVKPSSASKMVDHLKDSGLVQAERYGCISPTAEGVALGDYLLYRHNLLNQFLCYINHSENELEQVERIEHFIDERTVRNISSFLNERSIHS